MGHEAQCACECNGSVAAVKALIEPPELILRGAMRRRIPLAAMKHVRADGSNLRFTYQAESFALDLGAALALKWIKLLTTPPPSLAKKLGITAHTIVRTIGSIDDPALASALREAKATTPRKGDLILARVNTPAELSTALARAASQLEQAVPIWFIYPKGSGHPLNESIVRSTALATGIVDTKVAAVSPQLTALRFVKRRA
jgi:hypothetical protein